jgi:BioD-like phosphotransacetylase family protein
MAEILTIAEINSRFANEWVLVESPQTNEHLRVASGKVLYHSKDRDEVYRKAVELKPKHFAMLYTGEIPKDTAIVL